MKKLLTTLAAVLLLGLSARAQVQSVYTNIEWSTFLDGVVPGLTEFNLLGNPMRVPEQMELINTNTPGYTNTYTTVRYNTNTAWVVWAEGHTNKLDEILSTADVNVGFMRLTNQYTVPLLSSSVAYPVLANWYDSGVSSGFVFETNRLRWVRSYPLPATVGIQGCIAPSVGSNRSISLYLQTNGVTVSDATITQRGTSGVPQQFFIIYPITFTSNTWVRVAVSYNKSPVRNVVIERGMTVRVLR